MLRFILLGICIVAAVVFILGIFGCMIWLGVAALDLFLKLFMPIILLILIIAIIFYLIDLI